MTQETLRRFVEQVVGVDAAESCKNQESAAHESSTLEMADMQEKPIDRRLKKQQQEEGEQREEEGALPRSPAAVAR